LSRRLLLKRGGETGQAPSLQRHDLPNVHIFRGLDLWYNNRHAFNSEFDCKLLHRSTTDGDTNR